MTSFFRLSPAFCVENHVIVIKEETIDSKSVITIGYKENCSPQIRDKIERTFYKRITREKGDILFKPISTDEYDRLITKLYASSTNKNIVKKEEQLTKQTYSEAPIINLLNSLLLESISKHASDIHIEPEKNEYLIRLRIDGDLEEYTSISSETANALISRIKLLSELQLVEKRRAQDGKFIFTDNEKNIEVRVSIIPAWNGESVVLRILDTKAIPLDIDQLGFNDKHIEQLEKICELKNSLVLVCGPTGAGKTTTLAALLTKIADKKIKVVSIEDPVEYRLDGVIQFPVNTTIGMDFNDILRRVFRQDADVIMIGEIRDERTATTAVRAALTGHLVFATIHATDAASGILRLLDMEIAPYLLASVFGASIAQRLVKRKNGGRRVAAEILLRDENVIEAIRNKAPLSEIEKCFKKQSAIRLQDDIEREE